jgi:hypothetical protein
MSNILETIVQLCRSEISDSRKIRRIRALASIDAGLLTPILSDYIRHAGVIPSAMQSVRSAGSQNARQPSYVKGRVRAAKRMMSL